MAEELTPRTPEAEVAHQQLLRRCADHLALLQLVKNKLMEMSMVGEITDYTPYAEQLIEEVRPNIEKAERERIVNHLELLLKHSPLRSVSLRRELGYYTQALKEGA